MTSSRPTSSRSSLALDGAARQVVACRRVGARLRGWRRRTALGAQSAPRATKVCKLLRVKEVEKTLGQPVGEGVPSTRELSAPDGRKEFCTWETTERLQLVVSVQSKCARPDAKGCFKSDKRQHESNGEEKDLEQIEGHDAFYVFTGEVEVLVGKRILNVHFNNFATNMFSRMDFERRTVDAAEKAVKRL